MLSFSLMCNARCRMCVWQAQESTKSKREELTEFVPEVLKNMLLVMAKEKVLTPEWKVCGLLVIPIPWVMSLNDLR